MSRNCMQAVGGERLVGRSGAAEPLVAALLLVGHIQAFKARQFGIAAAEEVLGPCGHLRLVLRLIGFLQVVQDEEVRVVAGGSLLEATVRLAEQGFEAILQIGQRRGVDRHLHLEGAGQDVFRHLDDVDRLLLEEVALGIDDREAGRDDLEAASLAVAVRDSWSAFDLEDGLALDQRGREPPHLAGPAIGPNRHGFGAAASGQRQAFGHHANRDRAATCPCCWRW